MCITSAQMIIQQEVITARALRFVNTVQQSWLFLRQPTIAVVANPVTPRRVLDGAFVILCVTYNFVSSLFWLTLMPLNISHMLQVFKSNYPTHIISCNYKPNYVSHTQILHLFFT
jgi:hypothetical protein